MTEHERLHSDALEKQDRIFEHYAHIRQKIYGALFAIGLIVGWKCLIDYDPVQIWWGVLAVPAALFGSSLIVTKKNYPWELSFEDDAEE